MRTLDEIAEAIAKLSPSDRRALLRWMNERRDEMGDEQIHRYVDTGRLDALWKRAKQEIAEGEVMPLEKWMRLEEALSLYTRGALSAGETADLLGVPRAELDNFLCTRRIDRPYSEEEIMRDLAWAQHTPD
jgi:predicted HTH domain antitoxin